jgi:hypothetical protein
MSCQVHCLDINDHTFQQISFDYMVSADGFSSPILLSFISFLPLTNWFLLSIWFHPLLCIFSDSCIIYLPSVWWVHLCPHVIQFSMIMLIYCTQCWFIWCNWSQHIIVLQTIRSIYKSKSKCLEQSVLNISLPKYMRGNPYTIMDLCLCND